MGLRANAAGHRLARRLGKVSKRRQRGRDGGRQVEVRERVMRAGTAVNPGHDAVALALFFHPIIARFLGRMLMADAIHRVGLDQLGLTAVASSTATAAMPISLAIVLGGDRRSSSS